jgi:hypothetical protein
MGPSTNCTTPCASGSRASSGYGSSLLVWKSSDEGAGRTLEQVHHGDGIASWAVNARGLERGHGIRTGLEDTTVLPDGTPAEDNSALVREASRMIDERRLR